MLERVHDEQNSVRWLVGNFVEQFEPSYLFLAYYAALPFTLTPELVNYLRNRFLRGLVPWVAESDLLLSDLCRQIGYEQYMMDTAVRNYLIAAMKDDPDFGPARMQEAARLIVHYVRYLERVDPYLTTYELRRQQWGAMVFLDTHRKTAVREIGQTFLSSLAITNSPETESVTIVDKTTLATLVQLIQELAPQLVEYPGLVEYAADVRKLLEVMDSDSKNAHVILEQTTRSDQETIIGELRLPPLRPLLPIAEDTLSATEKAWLSHGSRGKATPHRVEFRDLYVRRLTFFQEVLRWLTTTQPNQRLLSLMGTIGIGKSWFMVDLYTALLDQGSFLPIWLNLSQIDEDLTGNPMFDIMSVKGRGQWLDWAREHAQKQCPTVTKPGAGRTFDAAFALFVRELCRQCHGLTPILLVDGYDEVVSESDREYLLERVFTPFYKEGCTRLIIARRDDKSLPHHLLGWNEQIVKLPSLNEDERKMLITNQAVGEELALILSIFLSGNLWINNCLYKRIINRNPIGLRPDDLYGCLKELLERAIPDSIEVTEKLLDLLQQLVGKLPQRWTARQLREKLDIRLENREIELLFQAGLLTHIEGTARYEVYRDLYILLQQYQKMTEGLDNAETYKS